MTGDFFLIYTTRQGGFFRTPTDNGEVRRFTREEYEEVKRTRKLDVTPSDWDVDHPDFPGREYVEPYFIALVKVEDNYDFGLKASRDADLVTA